MNRPMRGFRAVALAMVAAVGLPGAAGAQAAPHSEAPDRAAAHPGAIEREAAASPGPRTRAERTAYVETSRYDDVMAFLDSLDARPWMRRTTFGYTYEGRPLPLVVLAKGVSELTPGAVKETGRTRVLLLANIHAGEVEGKEAVQVLVRDLVAGRRAEWLDSLALLVAPIYNADGNDRVSVLNRYRQNGPLGGVGTRENAQGLDLNRDNMKLESPEARSLAALLNVWDPHVVVDLHTTNGTEHAYHLTYSPPLHPNTDDRIAGYLRDAWLPEVTGSVRDRTGWHTYDYGNAYAPEGRERGWYTFDPRPRFTTNYVGLRNRFAILSEAYSYASFEERVGVTRAFVDAILDFAHDHAGEIRRRVAGADAADLTGRPLAVRVAFDGGEPVEILMGATEERLSPYSGRRYSARLDVVRPERMPEYGRFRPVETVRVPAAYYLPPSLSGTADLLALHGVGLERLQSDTTLRVERFAIDSTRVAAQPFQGHREREVWGRWEPVEVTLPEGTWVIPAGGSAQARLVVSLLEPRSDDGVLSWNLLDDDLGDAPSAYPVYRSPSGAAP